MGPKRSSRTQSLTSASPRVSRKASLAMASHVPTEVPEPSMIPTEVSGIVDDDMTETEVSIGNVEMDGVVMKSDNMHGAISDDDVEEDESMEIEVEQGSLTELLLYQLRQDAESYEYDRNFCEEMLRGEALEAQEARSLKLRLLDLRHQARHTKNKIDLLTALGKSRAGPPSTATVINGLNAVSSFTPINGSGHVLDTGPNLALLHQAASASPPILGKRGRKSEDPSNTVVKKRKKVSTIPIGDLRQDPHNTVTRLGHWTCRLCTSPKYLGAPAGRQPSAPCKWPLRDVSKMMVHFGTMHQEHSDTERLVELGDALFHNKGPFEYWLRHSRHMDLGDGSIMGELISKLKEGKIPSILRRLSKAAANFSDELVVD